MVDNNGQSDIPNVIEFYTKVLSLQCETTSNMNFSVIRRVIHHAIILILQGKLDHMNFSKTFGITENNMRMIYDVILNKLSCMIGRTRSEDIAEFEEFFYSFSYEKYLFAKNELKASLSVFTYDFDFFAKLSDAFWVQDVHAALEKIFLLSASQKNLHIVAQLILDTMYGAKLLNDSDDDSILFERKVLTDQIRCFLNLDFKSNNLLDLFNQHIVVFSKILNICKDVSLNFTNPFVHFLQNVLIYSEDCIVKNLSIHYSLFLKDILNLYKNFANQIDSERSLVNLCFNHSSFRNGTMLIDNQREDGSHSVIYVKRFDYKSYVKNEAADSYVYAEGGDDCLRWEHKDVCLNVRSLSYDFEKNSFENFLIQDVMRIRAFDSYKISLKRLFIKWVELMNKNSFTEEKCEFCLAKVLRDIASENNFFIQNKMKFLMPTYLKLLREFAENCIWHKFEQKFKLNLKFLGEQDDEFSSFLSKITVEFVLNEMIFLKDGKLIVVVYSFYQKDDYKFIAALLPYVLHHEFKAFDVYVMKFRQGIFLSKVKIDDKCISRIIDLLHWYFKHYKRSLNENSSR